MKRTSANAPNTVDTAQLSRDLARVAGHVPVASLPRLAPLLATTAGDIEYELQGEVDERGRPAATLVARGSLAQRCDLCEREVELALDVRAQYYFVPDASALDELPLEGDDEREPLVGGRRIEVAELVEDEAILALPISPRHAACEAKLAASAEAGEGPSDEEASADAASDTRADKRNPFAVLASLKRRGGS